MFSSLFPQFLGRHGRLTITRIYDKSFSVSLEVQCIEMLVLLSVVIAIFVVIKFLDFYHKSFPSYKIAVEMGGPEPLTFCQTIKLAISLNRENIFTSFREYAQIYKKSYAFWCLGTAYVRIIKADDMEKILSSAKHTKKGFVYRFLMSFLGEGLLISGGQKWVQRRKILTPAFHFNILKAFLKVFQQEGTKLTVQLERSENPVINIPKLISRHTLDVICETAMGVKLDSLEESQIYRESIHQAGKVLVLRFIKPWLKSDFVFKIMGYESKLQKILTPIHSFTRKIIRERNTKFRDDQQANNEIYDRREKHAMLDTLLLAQKNNLIDVEGIREEVDTFTFEGHDTTASGITMILFSLAENPEVQEKVYEEIKSLREEKNGSQLEITDYSNLIYTDRVIKECLRLYPPVPYISRELTEDQEINGCLMPTGTLIEAHIYDLHRDPEFFPDPERFDPDRFLPENVERRHPFAYLPFSAGPRNCIGQKFALLEIKTVIESILMNFRLSPITRREDLIFIADLVLRTADPIKIKFTRRSQKPEDNLN